MGEKLDASNFLLLGNGRWQQDTLNRLIESALVEKLVVIDPYFPPREFEKVSYGAFDLNSYEEILELAIEKAIRFVVCDTSEYGMRTAARLRRDLNCPGLGEETTEIFTNKLKMREISKDLNGSDFHFVEVTTQEDLQKLTYTEDRSFVLKPVNSYASKGVWKFSTLEEGRRCLNENISSGFTENLVESFLDGTELTVESKISSGQILPIAISTKTRYKNNFAVATSLLFESASDNEGLKRVLKLNADFILKSHMMDGVSHGEYILGINGTVTLVEIAARGGGTRIYSKVLRELTGHDMIGHYLNSVSNLNFELPWTAPRWRFALLGFIYFPNGVLEGVNFDTLKFDWLLDLGLNAKIGDELLDPDNDNERHGYFWVLGNSLGEVRENVEELSKCMNGRVSGKSVLPRLMFDLGELKEPTQICLNLTTGV